MNSSRQIDAIIEDVRKCYEGFSEEVRKWHFTESVKELLDVLEKQTNNTFDRFHLYGIDSNLVEEFIDSDLTLGGSRKRSKDYMRTFPNRYSKMLIKTTNGSFSEVVDNGNQ